MVLWEITLGTAYFLGLKRTYKLALKIQRRLISPKYPKIRQFAHRRTRAVFDVAIKVHHNIQERDIEVGRNLGNWILRWLDRMKPSAHIRGHPPANSSAASSSVNATKQATNSSSELKTPGNVHTSRNGESSRHLFTSSRSTWSKPFPSIAMIMRPKPAAGTMTQYRHFCINGPQALLWNYSFAGLNGRLKAFA